MRISYTPIDPLPHRSLSLQRDKLKLPTIKCFKTSNLLGITKFRSLSLFSIFRIDTVTHTSKSTIALFFPLLSFTKAAAFTSLKPLPLSLYQCHHSKPNRIKTPPDMLLLRSYYLNKLIDT